MAITATRLNPNQELFCQLYVNDAGCFGNGTQSYIRAYKIDSSKKGKYNAAMVSAFALLRNPKILKRMNKMLDEKIKDEVVDRELVKVIIQSDNLPAKVQAIREYNKLKGRIIEKKDITSKGKQIGELLDSL